VTHLAIICTPDMAQDGWVLSLAIARQLRDAGLSWTPERGDRFVVADRDMDDEVFVLSDMTIELHHYPGGPVIGFNGTTEWALDSVGQQDALWVPTESQLRELLGAAFVRLERFNDGHRVMVSRAGVERSISAPTAADAYGLALLDAIRAFQDAERAHEWAE
jgi:hypothetical protein